MKGPAIFLAQFAADTAPHNSLDAITKWAADYGYKGVQIPTWDARIIDLQQAAESQAYVDDFKGVCARNGVQVSELSTHLQGQLVAAHPAYDELFDGFAPEHIRGNARAKQAGAFHEPAEAQKPKTQHSREVQTPNSNFSVATPDPGENAGGPGRSLGQGCI